MPLPVLSRVTMRSNIIYKLLVKTQVMTRDCQNTKTKKYMFVQKRFCWLIPLWCLFFSCEKMPSFFGKQKMFSNLPASETHIDFENNLTYTEAFNTYTYRNFYNGGGVAIGDLNNDGLPDVFFCGNMVSNKLYLNQGDLSFEDITQNAGLTTQDVWSTGVSMADVNGDGWLDIYVCKSGKPGGAERKNSLYINNGVKAGTNIPTFTDKATEYGIADYGLSTHAAFFDYDKDGDLDMYLLNNSIRTVGIYDLIKDQRKIRDPKGANKLYRNNGNTFEDVSEQAGIYGSAIGFGLGVTIGDINKDGWQDIYVSNDFFEKDYLYINQKDGTFSESLEQYMGEISLGSMGADMADINNDTYPDVFVTEMLPESNERIKTKTAFEDWNKYQSNIATGYYKQFPRNVLQLSLGQNQTGEMAFSEISRLAGVSATDWSWGALMVDLDNDGFKDIYVANGIFKDLTDLDYINYYADPITIKRLMKEKGKFLKELIDAIPSNALPNYVFHNQGNKASAFQFSNVAKDWGLDIPSFSNGSAYGDLDNDGDLDLVINNVNMPAMVLRNNARAVNPNQHFLSIKLKGLGKNTAALGTQVTVYEQGKSFYQELAPMRGYQSTVDNRLHFGLGDIQEVDSIQILWENQRSQVLKKVKTNQFLTIKQEVSKSIQAQKQIVGNTIFQDVTKSFRLNYQHQKSTFIDFNREPLLFHGIENKSAQTAVADVNGDGLDDFFVAGSFGKAGQLYLQTKVGKFEVSAQTCFEKAQFHEDTAILFFDANGDTFPDLYIASGGTAFIDNAPELKDRLFINDGKGNFQLVENALPNILENTSCVKAGDFDQDGDEDLLVCTRAKAFYYGFPVNAHLLQNDGKGNFREVSKQIAPALQEIGMVTDAAWLDYDQDHDLDFVLVGEWMGIKLFENNKGKFTEKSKVLGFENSNGFWNCLAVADINQDGFPDIVAGNLGENTRLKASLDKPLTMYAYDFDQNGKNEQIITAYNGKEAYPLATRKDLLAELPSLKHKLPLSKDYAHAKIEDLLDENILHQAQKFSVFTAASTCFINQRGKFIAKALPIEAQTAPIYALVINDFDGDKQLDILCGGNLHTAKPEIGIYDASVGQLLKGDGKGHFKVYSMAKSGLCIKGEIRSINKIAVKGKVHWLIAKKNEKISIIKHTL